MSVDEAPASRGVRDQGMDPDAGNPALAGCGWHVWEASRGRSPENLGLRWDEVVASLDGCVTQTAGWMEYALATDYRRAVLVAGLSADGRAQAVAVGFVAEPRWPLQGFRTIRFPAYPAAGGDEAAMREALRVCERAARECRCMSIEFTGTGQPDAASLVEPLEYTTQRSMEYVFDLTGGEDALWDGLKRQHRKNVRRSAKKGVEVVRLQSLESVRTLRSLQAEVVGRHAGKGDAFALRPVEAYDALHRALIAPGLGRVYCATLDGMPVSAALFLTFGRRAQSIYSGSNRQGLEAYGEYAMYWQALSELSREGFAELQMGAADPTAEDPDSPAHGLHQFKMGFGARTRPVAAASKQLRPMAVRVYGALKRVRSPVSALRR